MPFAFTESGVAMLSCVLHSQRAIKVNIEIMIAFTKLRKQLRVHQIDLNARVDSLERKFEQFEIQPRNIRTPASDLTESDPVEKIQNAVSKYWGITIEDLKSARRTKEISLPRQIAIYLIRKHMHISFSDIGRHFGQRDHTTILYAYRKIDAASGSNSIIKRAIDSLQRQI